MTAGGPKPNRKLNGVSPLIEAERTYRALANATGS
jgi:hypothetical protein